jgi:hypothetical protein
VGVAGQEPEPARYLQYRVTMETFHPLRSPRLEELTVTYDEQLLAAHLSAQIAPLRPVLGAETMFTYTLNAQVDAGYLGFDRIRLDLPGTVLELRLEGAPVPAPAVGRNAHDRRPQAAGVGRTHGFRQPGPAGSLPAAHQRGRGY